MMYENVAKAGVGFGTAVLTNRQGCREPGRQPDQPDRFFRSFVRHEIRQLENTYTYGTAIAHVAVDPGTGGVEVLDYCVVDDV
jgi:CO/xanthine dehydrogenase Mo-binding subunit